MVKKGLIVAGWLAAWQLASLLFGNPLLFAGPWQTALSLVRNLPTAGFWLAVWFSFSRIALGFLGAALLAIAAAVLAWKAKIVAEILHPAVAFVKSVPVVSIIVLLLVWVGSRYVSVIAVALMVFPPIYYSVLEGLGAESREMVQMLDAFGVGRARRARYYYLPLVMPYAQAAFRVALGVAWKSGVAAEVIGIPDGSIGEGIYFGKISLETADVFAWTFVVVGLAMLSERAFLATVGALSRGVSQAPPALSGDAGAAAPMGGSRSLPGLSARGAGAGSGKDAGADAGGSGIGRTSGGVSDAGVAEAGSDGSDGAGPGGKVEGGSAASGRKAGGGVGSASPADARTAALALADVSLEYGRGPVLSHVGLELRAGERACVMGPSGTGKTTLLDVACGLREAQAGEAWRAGKVARVFQEDRLIGQLTAWDNVRLVAACSEREAQAWKADLDALLGTDSAAVRPGEMSGGMKRKTALVRALAAGGVALVLDEPFAGMDADSHRAALELVSRKLGERALLVATHDAADPEALGARTLRLNEGVLVGA